MFLLFLFQNYRRRYASNTIIIVSVYLLTGKAGAEGPPLDLCLSCCDDYYFTMVHLFLIALGLRV